MSFYRFARAVVLSCAQVVFRVRVAGNRARPAVGRVHRRSVAPLDPRRAVRRVHHEAHVRFLAKDELFKNPALDRLFAALGAVEVERGTADRGALRALEAVLRQASRSRSSPRAPATTGPRSRSCSTGRPTWREVRRADRAGRDRRQRAHPRRRASCSRGIHRVAVSVGHADPAAGARGRARRSAAKRLTEQLQIELQRCFDDAERLAR